MRHPVREPDGRAPRSRAKRAPPPRSFVHATVVQLLADNPLLLLFAVIALGYPLGRIAVQGIGLGVSAILFAGLAVGALDPRLRLPEIVPLLGLVIFVYSVGLSSGPGFFASLRRDGVRNAAFALTGVVLAALGAALARSLLGLSAEQATGLFAGSMTNTPTLAAALDQVRAGASGEGRSAPAVVAYSVTYPLGILVPILVVALVPRAWRRASGDELRRSQEWRRPAPAGRESELAVGTARVSRADAVGRTIGALRRESDASVQPGRVRRADDAVELATDELVVREGDLVSMVGTPAAIDRFIARLGERSQEAIHLDRRELDVRRVFVSNRAVAGRALRELDLPQQFGAVVTALRRGDTDWVPNGRTVLQLGDRVRVLARREALARVAAFLGDSYKAVSEFDVLTFSFGIVLGIIVGLIRVPLPGGVEFSLGIAGGPLVVAMLLGARGRTGPLVWGIPYAANMTLRQIGIMLFFAGVGTRSGYAAVASLGDPATLGVVAAGGIVTATIALLLLVIGRWLLLIPEGPLMGMIAGVHTQPAALSFALERRGDDAPNVGYASVSPFSTILKIIAAQLLLAA